MSKKSAAVRRREDQQRHERNLTAAARPRPLTARLAARLDRTAERLARRPRPVRMLIAGLVALAITAAVGLILFNVAFPVQIQGPGIDPAEASSRFTAIMVALVVVGAVLYWVGWRIMIGFDFADEPLKPGRTAAAWVYAGLLVLFILVVAFFLGLIQAASPT